MRDFSFALPHPFRSVPALGTSEFEAWAADVVAERASDSGPGMTADVDRLVEAMSADPFDGHRWFVAIPDAPYRAGIAAFGWAGGGPAHSLDRPALADRVSAGSPNDSGSLYSEISLHDIAAGPTLVISQFQSARGSSNALLIERCGALLLDENADMVINLELVAVDLRSFEDIVSTSLQILDSVAWVEAPA